MIVTFAHCGFLIVSLLIAYLDPTTGLQTPYPLQPPNSNNYLYPDDNSQSHPSSSTFPPTHYHPDYPPASATSSSGFLQAQPPPRTRPRTRNVHDPASAAHALGLGPFLVVLDDPSNKYLADHESFMASRSSAPPHPIPSASGSTPDLTSTSASASTSTYSIPPVPPPLPVTLPRLPTLPPLVLHQDQLYFDDGLGAPGRCPHDRKWGHIGRQPGEEDSGWEGEGVGTEHRKERGIALSDVEMDDFMVDLGDLISKEYDAWIERCWYVAMESDSFARS